MLGKGLMMSHLDAWEEKEINVEIINAFLTGLCYSVTLIVFFSLKNEDLLIILSFISQYLNMF